MLLSKEEFKSKVEDVLSGYDMSIYYKIDFDKRYSIYVRSYMIDRKMGELNFAGYISGLRDAVQLTSKRTFVS